MGTRARESRTTEPQRTLKVREDSKSGNDRGMGGQNRFLWLYGQHPVMAALNNKNRRVREVLLAKMPTDYTIPANIPYRIVTRDQIDSIVGKDAVHQGIIARVDPLPVYAIEDLIRDTKKSDRTLVVILDQVVDPHNIGAVLRSSAAFNVAAVILPNDGAPEESGVLAKSASGALELVPLIRVTNLARALSQLKKAEFWTVGMDGAAKQSIVQQKLPARCALVMGSEGDGMRRLTMENCDYITKIPMYRHKSINNAQMEGGSDTQNRKRTLNVRADSSTEPTVQLGVSNDLIESLNVSNACAIALYEWNRLYSN